MKDGQPLPYDARVRNWQGYLKRRRWDMEATHVSTDPARVSRGSTL